MLADWLLVKKVTKVALTNEVSLVEALTAVDSILPQSSFTTMFDAVDGTFMRKDFIVVGELLVTWYLSWDAILPVGSIVI